MKKMKVIFVFLMLFLSLCINTGCKDEKQIKQDQPTKSELNDSIKRDKEIRDWHPQKNKDEY